MKFPSTTFLSSALRSATPTSTLRTNAQFSAFRAMSSPASSIPPQDSRRPIAVPIQSMEDSIRSKLEDLLSPSTLEIRNDSSKHAHHAPMKVEGAFTGETHFFVLARSAAFEGKNRVARHRMVNNALSEEFDRGLHALSLKLETEDGK